MRTVDRHTSAPGRAVTSYTSAGIAYDREGPRGELPLVLIHAGVADRRMWDPIWPALTQIAVPVLVLVGGLDLATVHAAAARVVAETAGARRVDWPDVGHLPALERPADFLDLLQEWIAE
jgi:pimeloyl-ACP methyl ester carboxylesterase